MPVTSARLAACLVVLWSGLAAGRASDFAVRHPDQPPAGAARSPSGMVQYPPTRRVDVVDELHGARVLDPYRWLEEVDSPEAKAWVKQENRVTFGYLKHLPARKRILKRLTALWNYERFGLPLRRGDRFFMTRNNGLQNQDVLYWSTSPAGELQCLLDPNQLSKDGTVALADWVPSHDGTLLAYGLSEAGSDWVEYHVRDVATGQDLADRIQWSKFSSVAWTKDNRGFFYSRYDEPKPGEELKESNHYQKLFHHRLGTPQGQDTLIYQRPDQKEWGFDPTVTEDGRYLIIAVWKGTERETGLFYRDLAQPGSAVVELLKDFDASYEFVGSSGSVLYLKTDLSAPMARVIAIDLAQPERGSWREIIPESQDALESVSFVGDRFLTTTMHDASHVAKAYREDGVVERDLALPGLGAVGGFAGRQADREAFYSYSNFVTPDTIYRYDVETGESAVLRRPTLRFDPDRFVTERVFYPSKDGTRVPIFICRRKDLTPSPETPCRLYAYGGFAVSMLPGFWIDVPAWLEMGGLYAQADIRGGGEYGKAWHEAGRKQKRQTCFDDFIAAAEWLIAQCYTSPRKLAITGGSNGGLLVGACLTQRPDLFGACVPAVGVLDMIRFPQYTIGWAWTSEYGSPDDPDDFRALLAYSPYHNLKPGTRYPWTLITTGDHDDRVFPAHSLKFAAALQHAQAGPGPVLLRVETRTGHGAGKPTKLVLEELADSLAFTADAVGMDWPDGSRHPRETEAP